MFQFIWVGLIGLVIMAVACIVAYKHGYGNGRQDPESCICTETAVEIHKLEMVIEEMTPAFRLYVLDGKGGDSRLAEHYRKVERGEGEWDPEFLKRVERLDRGGEE